MQHNPLDRLPAGAAVFMAFGFILSAFVAWKPRSFEAFLRRTYFGQPPEPASDRMVTVVRFLAGYVAIQTAFILGQHFVNMALK
jgi:hypothetical protein